MGWGGVGDPLKFHCPHRLLGRMTNCKALKQARCEKGFLIFFPKAFKCKLLLHIPSWRLDMTVRRAVTPRWWFHRSLLQQPLLHGQNGHTAHTWKRVGVPSAGWNPTLAPPSGPGLRAHIYWAPTTVPPASRAPCSRSPMRWPSPSFLTHKEAQRFYEVTFLILKPGKWGERDSNPSLSHSQSCALGLLTWTRNADEEQAPGAPRWAGLCKPRVSRFDFEKSYKHSSL